MSTGQTRGLKQIGILADTKAATQAFAESLGKQTDQLTTTEQLEAKRNAVLVAMKKYLEDNGKAQTDFADRVAQSKVFIQNFTDALGVAIAQNPVLQAGMAFVADAMKKAFGAETPALVQNLSKYIGEGAIMLTSFADAAIAVGRFVGNVWFGLNAIFNAFVAGVADGASVIVDELASIVEVSAKLGLVSDQTATDARAMADGIKIFADQSRTATEAALKEQDAFNEKMDKAEGFVGDLRKTMQAATTQATELGDKGKKGLDETGKAATGASAEFNKLVKAYRDANTEAGIHAKNAQTIAVIFAALGATTKTTATDLGKATEALNKLGAEGIAAAEKLRTKWEEANNIGFIPVMRTINTLAPVVAASKDGWLSYADAQDKVKVSAEALEKTKNDELMMQGALHQALTSGAIDYTAFIALGGKLEEQTKRDNVALTQMLNAVAILGNAIGGTLGKALTAGAALWDQYAQKMDAAAKIADSGARSHAEFAAKLDIVTGAANVLGSAVQGTAGDMLHGAASGAQMGAAIGSIIPGVGTLAGAIVGGLGGALSGFIGGMDKAIKATNDARDAFFLAQGGFEAFGAKMAAASDEDWAKKIFNAKTVEEFNAVVLAAQKLLQDQNDAQTALTDAVKRYNIETSEMGPIFTQQQLDEKAKQLFQDWTVMTGALVDHNAVLTKMGPAMSEYIDQAVSAGVSIPLALKKQIDEMYRAGTLIHANGDAFTEAEYQGLNYSQTMTQQFMTLIDKLTQWINLLRRVPGNINTNINTNYSHSGDNPGDQPAPPDNQADRQAAGGLDMIFHRPTSILVGEGGSAERVQVGPASGSGSTDDMIGALYGAIASLGSKLDPYVLTKAMRDGMQRAAR
jgi:hypothetical protein